MTYIIIRIPQITGETRFIGAGSRQQQRATQDALYDNPAIIDGLSRGVDYVAIRDCAAGKRPSGWID